MLAAQAGDLMPAVGDLGNQFWHLISNPAEDEECRFCVVLVEQFERSLSVSLDSGFEAVPLLLFDEPAE